LGRIRSAKGAIAFIYQIKERIDEQRCNFLTVRNVRTRIGKKEY